jgi:hypothetical protein
VLGGGLVAAFLFARSTSRVATYQGFDSVGFLDLKLPFTIPCATDSSDAAPVYVALRARDRKALKQLFSERKMLAVEKGAPVRMVRFGGVAGVKIEGGAHAGAICFVPPDVVPVIRKHAGG